MQATAAVFGILRFPPERLDEVWSRLRTLVESTRRNDGCIAYDVAEDAFDPSLLRFSELWPCFGDSGGPSFLTINEALSIVGLTSAGDYCPELNCDPCKTATTSTRVDAYATWIDAKLREPAP